jgi:hypothetical protein
MLLREGDCSGEISLSRPAIMIVLAAYEASWIYVTPLAGDLVEAEAA